MWYKCEVMGQPNSSIEIPSEDNPYEKLWIVWRRVKIKKIMQIL